MGLQNLIRDNLIAPGGLVGDTEKYIDTASQKAQAGYTEAIGTYGGVADEYKPYMDVGKESASALSQLFSNPEGYLADPMVQARLKTQNDTIQNSASAKGHLFGGQTLLELMKKGGEFASTELDKATDRYAKGAQIGLTATGGYDAAKANLAEMQIGKGLAGSRGDENQAQWKAAQANFSSGMWSSWFGGSGPFGSMTAGGGGGK